MVSGFAARITVTAPSPPNSAAATSSIVASRRNRFFGTIRVFGRSALTPFRSPFVCRPALPSSSAMASPGGPPSHRKGTKLKGVLVEHHPDDAAARLVLEVAIDRDLIGLATPVGALQLDRAPDPLVAEHELVAIPVDLGAQHLDIVRPHAPKRPQEVGFEPSMLSLARSNVLARPSRSPQQQYVQVDLRCLQPLSCVRPP